MRYSVIVVCETLSRVYLAALSIFAQSIPDMPRFAHVQQMLKNRKLRIPQVSPVSLLSSTEPKVISRSAVTYLYLCNTQHALLREHRFQIKKEIFIAHARHNLAQFSNM